MSEHEVIEWLEERRQNCLNIAKNKSSKDRAGWLEDAEYLRQAIMMILGITYRDIEETSPERPH